jgi:hypothetical protein
MIEPQLRATFDVVQYPTSKPSLEVLENPVVQ